ncbi:phospholipase ABHD3-like isoform X2 [Syngnathus acus]|uniref:phospholipase ABHD3-like isoform X2 n=1 Tax=Syngnathus acus TaxID=161584 RepID=UPI0018861203|nr:phospholipase ABHD3-like isoform X2 [Syngnathus acus]
MSLSLLDLWTVRWELVSRVDTVLLCSLTAAFCYLWGRKSQRPLVVCGEKFGDFLQERCPALSEIFRPTPWCWGGRLQTVLCFLIKSRPHVEYRNERIRTADGGQISLDWEDNDGSAAYPQASTRPTVLILPGLTGNSRQSYVLHAVRQAAAHGYRCVVFNNRGFGGEELLTPLTFCAANTSDLELVIQHVKSLYPQAPVFGLGVSLGGMLLLNYLGRKGGQSGLVAGLTVSVPWDAFKSAQSMEAVLNWLLFNKHLTRGLCAAVRRSFQLQVFRLGKASLHTVLMSQAQEDAGEGGGHRSRPQDSDSNPRRAASANLTSASRRRCLATPRAPSTTATPAPTGSSRRRPCPSCASMPPTTPSPRNTPSR